ncbi:DEAD/DEAH box helicase [Candidatus Parcubacteria bacterium]|nr:DEAD/DEAH box helicase [Candidatus Parcubacteria bacterium]
MTAFKKLGLNSEIMKSLDDLGFTEPSPIQEKTIPFILKSENDLIALAQTGTGKTAAFGLPILQKIKANERVLQAIILCPTRELCIQISRDITKLAKYSEGLVVTAVYGGEKIDFQIKALKRGTNIVVGTPGRVHDLIRRKVLKLQAIKWLVLDEADEMLDMGFKDDLDAILTETPKTRQTLLFSATISKSVRLIAKQYMTDAEEIIAGEQNVGAEKVSHEYYIVGARDRFEALKRILDYLPGVYGILFCRTRRETGEVSDKLKQVGYDTDALHGEISQIMRTKIMDRFKRKQIHLLVATDVAARGIDVSDLSHVINYSLPGQDEAYTHRSGRTGRAQKSGVSISILNPRDAGRIKRLESIIGKKFEYKKVPSGEDICQKQIDNFFAEIENTKTEEIGNERYFQEFSERLKKTSKEDLIKYFIANKFSRLASACKNTRDLNAKGKAVNARMGSEDGVGLKINFGRKHGLDIKGVFALINSNRNLKGVEIGKINLMPEYSVFSVEKKRADEVIKYLKGTNFRGKKIDVSKSNMIASYAGKRRGGSGRGFRRKRKEPRKVR